MLVMPARRNPFRSIIVGQTEHKVTAKEVHQILVETSAQIGSKNKRADVHRLKELAAKFDDIANDSRAWEESAARMKNRAKVHNKQTRPLEKEMRDKLQQLKAKGKKLEEERDERKNTAQTADPSPHNDCRKEKAERKHFL